MKRKTKTLLNTVTSHWVWVGVTCPVCYDHNEPDTHKFCWQVRRTAALQYHAKGLQWVGLCGSLCLCVGSISQVRGAIHHQQLSPSFSSKVRSIHAGGEQLCEHSQSALPQRLCSHANAHERKHPKHRQFLCPTYSPFLSVSLFRILCYTLMHALIIA